MSRLKVNTAAFIFQVAASLSYILLYLQGIGYPLALFSILMFVVRIIIGVAVLVNSRKAHHVSVAGSAIGFVYIALSFFASNSILVTLPLALEIGALVATLESLSKIGKTKQPSPLDMPVYG